MLREEPEPPERHGASDSVAAFIDEGFHTRLKPQLRTALAFAQENFEYAFLVLFAPFFLRGFVLEAFGIAVSAQAVLTVSLPVFVLWVWLKPFRRSCGSTLRRLAAQCLPIEIYFSFMLLTWQPVFAGMFLVLSAVLPPVVFSVHFRKPPEDAMAQETHRASGGAKRPRSDFYRLTIPLAAVILLIPSVWGLATIRRPLEAAVFAGGDAFGAQENVHALSPTAWGYLNAKERGRLLQALLNRESALLGLDPILLTDDFLAAQAALEKEHSGAHGAKTVEELLKLENSYDAVRIVCHQARHAMQAQESGKALLVLPPEDDAIQYANARVNFYQRLAEDGTAEELA
jgi:hypothetical protein